MSEPTEADFRVAIAVFNECIGAIYDALDEAKAAGMIREHVLAETSCLMRALSETRVQVWQLQQERDALKEQLSKTQ